MNNRISAILRESEKKTEETNNKTNRTSNHTCFESSSNISLFSTTFNPVVLSVTS